jgi:hypothetical protein
MKRVEMPKADEWSPRSLSKLDTNRKQHAQRGRHGLDEQGLAQEVAYQFHFNICILGNLKDDRRSCLFAHRGGWFFVVVFLTGRLSRIIVVGGGIVVITAECKYKSRSDRSTTM